MTRPLRSLVKMVNRSLAITLTGVVVVSIAACGTSENERKPLRYLYATVDQVILMDGADQVAAIDREMGLYNDPWMSQAVWTTNGRYVGFLAIPQTTVLDASGEDVGSDRQSLTVIDAQSGVVANYPCAGCNRVAAVGDRFWMLGDRLRSVSVLDPAAAKPEFTPFTISGMTTSRPALPVPTILGGSQNAALITQSFDSGVVDNRERHALYFADDAGAAQLIGDFPMIGWTYAATATSTSNAGKVVLTSRLGIGLCASRTSTIWTLSPDSPQLASTDISAMKPSPSAASSHFGIRLSQPWWGLDGHFHVAAARWTCSGPSQSTGSDADLIEEIEPWRVFRLDDATWVDENIDAMTSAQLSASTRVDHHPATCVSDKTVDPQQGIPDRTPPDQVCLSGPLRLITPEGDKQIAAAAIALWPQPTTS